MGAIYTERERRKCEHEKQLQRANGTAIKILGTLSNNNTYKLLIQNYCGITKHNYQIRYVCMCAYTYIEKVNLR